MGDSGEGLIDAEGRIQERTEELARERNQKREEKAGGDPELLRSLESLKLARTRLQCQLDTSNHARRKVQLRQALEDIDRKISETSARINPDV